MSKITISAILTIIRIALTIGEKLIRSFYMVLDIVDDGTVNDSVPRPDWYEKVVSSISNIEFALRNISDVADNLSIGITPKSSPSE